jgi:hypothetical protein
MVAKQRSAFFRADERCFAGGKGVRASAADLKVLLTSPRARNRTFKSKAALES